MRDEFDIFAVGSTSISIDDLLTDLDARGISVQWQSRYVSEQGQSMNWTGGTFVPKDRTEPKVALSKEELSPDEVAEWLGPLTDHLPAEQRPSLEKIEFVYRIEASGGTTPERGRLLLQVVDTVAERSTGLIHEIGVGELMDLNQFRQQSPELCDLHGPSEAGQNG